MKVGSAGGPTRDYSSLSAWESARQRDLSLDDKCDAGSFAGGNFTANEVVNFSPSGAVGTFRGSDYSTYLIVTTTSGTPAASDTATGASSGASCSVSAYTANDGCIEVAECYDDGSGSSGDLGTVIVLGWVTSTTNYIHIRAADGHRHDGTPESGARIYLNVPGGHPYWRQDGMIIEGIEFYGDGVNAIIASRIDVTGNCTITLQDCYVHDNRSTPFYYWANTANPNMNAWYHNCVLSDPDYIADHACFQLTSSDTGDTSHVRIMNCSVLSTTWDNDIRGLVYGDMRSGGALTVTVRNTWVYGPQCTYGTQFDLGDAGLTVTAASDYNACEDTSSPGANSVDNITVVVSGGSGNRIFIESLTDGSQDVHLTNDASCIAIDGGNRNADVWATDMDEDARPSGTCDMGADEFTVLSGVWFYNKGKAGIIDGSIDEDTDTIKMLLVDENYVFDADHNYVSQVSSDELSGTGYVRKTLSVTVTQDDANDKADVDASDVTWAGLNAGTIAGAIMFKDTGDDATSPLIALFRAAEFPVVTSGDNEKFQVHASGLFSGTE